METRPNSGIFTLGGWANRHSARYARNPNLYNNYIRSLNIRSFHVKNCTFFNANELVNLLAICSHMEKLTITNSRLRITGDDQGIRDVQPEISGVTIPVTHIEINGKMPLEWSQLARLCPRIQKITLKQTERNKWKSLTQYKRKHGGFNAVVLERLSNLRSLELDCRVNPEDAKLLFRHLPNLKIVFL